MSDDTWTSIVTFVGNQLVRQKSFKMDIETFEMKFALTKDDHHEMLMRLDRRGEGKPPFTFHTEPEGHNGNLCRMIIFRRPE